MTMTMMVMLMMIGEGDGDEGEDVGVDGACVKIKSRDAADNNDDDKSGEESGRTR